MNNFLTNNELFVGLNPNEINLVLDCLNSYKKKYIKNEVILEIGDTTQAIGIVIDGSVNIQISDYWGNRSIITHIGPFGSFAETYAFLKGEKLVVEVVANENCNILFINIQKLLSDKTLDSYQIVLYNLLVLMAKKNLIMMQKIEHLSSKSIRDRILSYLSFEAIKNTSKEFDIPFNRERLADYLNVDRSALSNALSKMQAEGIINYNRNHFILNQSLYDN